MWDREIWWHRMPLKFRLGKVGAWIQRSSVDSPLAFNNKISWFICDDRIFDKVLERANERKIILAYGGGENENRIIENIIKRRQYITAAVWDYEIKATEEQAFMQLGKVHKVCKSLKLPFGVAVLAGPDSSHKTNGVAFDQAHKLCDFLMPMLYCQWWSHNPEKTRNAYVIELRASTVPLLPIIARHTTRETIKEPLLTSELLVSNYSPLNLKSFAVWNVATTDKDFWDKAKKL